MLFWREFPVIQRSVTWPITSFQIKLYLSRVEYNRGSRPDSEMLTYKPLNNNAVLRKISVKLKIDKWKSKKIINEQQ